MTKNQGFYVELLRQLRTLDSNVQIYTDDGLALQASRFDREQYGSPGNTLKCIKEPGVVEQFRLLLPSRYGGNLCIVRAWALAGVVQRPTSGPHIEGSAVVDRCRQLRDTQPGAAFYAGEAFGGKDVFYYGREGYVDSKAFFSVYVREGDNTVRHCYDLAEPRTFRQQFAHQLWRRPGRNYNDSKYGTYTKAQFVKLLDWADAAREDPKAFVVLTFGTTPVWFPRQQVALGYSRGTERATVLAGGEEFIVRESKDEVKAILRG